MMLIQVLTFEEMARPAWLVPYYTEDINKACTSFRVIGCPGEGSDPQFRIPGHSKSTWRPCLISICDKDIQSKVSRVQLVRVTNAGQLDEIRKLCMATGVTDCIFGVADADWVYLMWR